MSPRRVKFTPFERDQDEPANDNPRGRPRHLASLRTIHNTQPPATYSESPDDLFKTARYMAIVARHIAPKAPPKAEPPPGTRPDDRSVHGHRGPPDAGPRKGLVQPNVGRSMGRVSRSVRKTSGNNKIRPTYGARRRYRTKRSRHVTMSVTKWHSTSE